MFESIRIADRVDANPRHRASDGCGPLLAFGARARFSAWSQTRASGC